MHLEKPAQLDEMMSSSSRETNGTDSGRGCSEDDSQAVESIRSETGRHCTDEVMVVVVVVVVGWRWWWWWWWWCWCW